MFINTDPNFIVMLPLTKIICTIGPSCSSASKIEELYTEGLNVARINFSHGDYEQHKKIIENIRKVNNKYPDRKIGIGLDTKGPELRIKIQKEINVVKGDYLFIKNTPDIYTADEIFVDVSFSGFNGKKIFIDDGIFEMRVESVSENTIVAIAESDYTIKNNKRISMAGVKILEQYPTESDISDIKFGLLENVDYLFLSFVNSVEDVKKIKEIFVNEKVGVTPLLVPKIETLAALNNIKEILSVADGIMIARGDLAVEIGFENLFSAQKIISEECRKANKFFIVATQMIESMKNNLTPMRAEIMDIGNAVLDGCSAVMTSAETAMGCFPVQTVKMIRKILLNAENYMLTTETADGQVKDAYETPDSTNENSAVILFCTSKKCLPKTIKTYGNKKIFVITQNDNFLRCCAVFKGVFSINSCLTYDECLTNKDKLNEIKNIVEKECGSIKKLILINSTVKDYRMAIL
ncbi:Pyruvate kinase [Spraguea lophii 42_110]|uniref:Pyruvate kinase n=1 Tax=Spraguea lophii (strain 42_110) TaxID=1358809 RepID=S7W6B6_SPRLO|nr:Pyruvate kinase [Spraguea lophii 42_110]